MDKHENSKGLPPRYRQPQGSAMDGAGASVDIRIGHRGRGGGAYKRLPCRRCGRKRQVHRHGLLQPEQQNSPAPCLPQRERPL